MTGSGRRSSISASMEASCSALLSELEIIWTDIGETESKKDCMLLELEKECMQVYRRKLDEAGNARARLHHKVAANEAELSALQATLGENTTRSQMNKELSLKEQLALVKPSLEELRLEKKEREKLFTEIMLQIEQINKEITGYCFSNKPAFEREETDLSLRKLNEYQAQLRTLQKEKSDRVRKVLEDVNQMHCLCGVLGMDFGKMLDEVHPDLRKTSSTGQATSISNKTLDDLALAIQKLKDEKKSRTQKLRDTLASLYNLWNLDSNVETRHFERVKFISEASDDDIKDFGILSLETLEQVTAELERLTKLKAIRMKELVLKKRTELEDLCRWAHIEPDSSIAPDKIIAVLDSGIVDAYQLLDKIETHIEKSKEEAISRKDIMNEVGKWLAACEEEKWLDDYNQDDSRYGGRGAHLNRKRAEKARIILTKIPGMVENLVKRTIAWENERDRPFMYDGVQLVSILEEYKITRQQRAVENRRYRNQKKLQDMLLSEKELIHWSKPSSRRCNSLGRRSSVMVGGGNGIATPRRASVGGSGHLNGYFRDARRPLSVPLNFVAPSKDDTTTSSFASISGSEPESPSVVATLTDGTAHLAQ